MMPRSIYSEWHGSSPVVDRLWRLDVPDMPRDPKHHRVLPDGCLDLVVSLHKPDPGRLGWGELLIAGPTVSADLVEVRPGDVFLGVRFRPGWGGRCLGIDPQSMTGRVARASDVDRRYEALESELAAGVGTGRMGAIFLSMLRVTTHAVGPASRAQIAVRRLRASGGRIDLGRLAGELSISPRTLRREIAAEAGLPPKVLARVFRFQYALTRPTSSLATLAAEAGYADQAHMTREFGALAGVSPARWMAEMFKTCEAGRPSLKAS